MGCGSAGAADGDTNEVLLKKLEKMEQRIETLEAELKQKTGACRERLRSDKSAKSAATPASPKNANAAVPADQPQASQSKQDPQEQTRSEGQAGIQVEAARRFEIAAA